MITQEELRKSMELAFVDEMLSANEAKTNDELYEESSNDPLFYGLPHTKQYPMPDEKHVKSAIKFFNYVTAEDEEELARNINKQIKHFKMDDINVGEGNRFKQYYKPATENSAESVYMPKQVIEKAKHIFETAKRHADKAVKSCLKSRNIKTDSIKFSNTWNAHNYDAEKDLKSGLINMTLFKVDIPTYISDYRKNRPFTNENKIISEIKLVLSQIVQIMRKDTELKKALPPFNIGYIKRDPKTFIFCIEWKFKYERSKIRSTEKREATKAKFDAVKKSAKDFKKELKEELSKPINDIPDKNANRQTDIFNRTSDSEGYEYDPDEEEERWGSSFDSVMTSTAPIVPYSKILTKNKNGGK